MRPLRLFGHVCISMVACLGGPAQALIAQDASAAPMATAAAAPADSANVLLAPSTLPFQAPDFSRIRPVDYLPAFAEGLRQQRDEVDRIANDKQAPSFDNTIVAMERSGQLLARVSRVFFQVAQSDDDAALEGVQAQVAPKLSRQQDWIWHDSALFARIKAIYGQRQQLHLDRESDRLLAHYYEKFVREGALLDEGGRARLKDIDARMATLSSRIQANVIAATRANAVLVDDAKELDGLSRDAIADAARRAAGSGHPGQWLLPLANTTSQPILAMLANRGLRERIYRASISRSDEAGAYDNRSLVDELAHLRAQRAALFGYPNYAAYALSDHEASNPQVVIDRLSQVARAATAQVESDRAKLQGLVDRQQAAGHGPGFRLKPWDWPFYAEQLRGAQPDAIPPQARFELDRVLNDGVFYVAGQLYGLTFKERKDLPVYDPDVRVFEVFGAEGKSIALVYFDGYSRGNKNGGAWMDSFVEQNRLLRQRPVITNVFNFTRPAPGQPALLSPDEVATLFNIFGYTLDGILSDVKYPAFSGWASTPRDLVTFPSQFNETWAFDPKVFAHYAKDYRTGKPMPAEIAAKIKASATFDQGYETTEYVAAALLDMAWHQIPADAPRQDVDAFEATALGKYGINVANIAPRYRSAYFMHVWSADYAANYYAYMWTDMLAQDAHAWFDGHGGMTRGNGQHLASTLLSRGSSEDAHRLYLDFRGKEPTVQPYLEKKGLAAEPAKP